MSEIENIINEKISTAIEKAVEKYKSPEIIKGVPSICNFLQISRNTFLATYQKGEYGKAVKKIGRMFYLCPLYLFN